MLHLKLINKKNNLCMYELYLNKKKIQSESKIMDIINRTREKHPKLKCFVKIGTNDDITCVVFENEIVFLDIINYIYNNLSNNNQIIALSHIINAFDNIIYNEEMDKDKKLKLFNLIINRMYCKVEDQKIFNIIISCCIHLMSSDYEQIAYLLNEAAMLCVMVDNDITRKKIELVLKRYLPIIKDIMYYDYEEIIDILDIEYGFKDIECNII